MSDTPLFLRTLRDEDLPEFETELRVRQIVDLARQTPFHAAANIGNGILLASVFWGRLSHAAIVLWLGVFTGFSAIGLYRWWRKRHWPIPEKVSRRALIRTTLFALFAGLMWAAAVIYAFPRDDVTRQMIILFLVGGLGSGAVGSMPSQPVAAAAFMGPPLVSVLILLATQDGQVTHVFLLMALLFVVVLAAALNGGFASFATIVRTRVDSRTLQTRLLEAELAASTAANAAKSQFLANMSHELRTPLNAVIGFSEIIRDQSLGPQAMASYREYAADIHAAGEHLLHIINDVLDISKIEAGKLELQESETDIGAVVQSSIKLTTQAAFEAGITLHPSVPPDLPMLMADELRLKQALMKLLSNAVKFSNRGGVVTVGAGLRPDGAMAVWVADTGIGMSESETAMALQPFRQVANSLSRPQNGIGVGLSLVDGIVRLHGGTLELVSAPGHGTTVTLILPAERVVRPG